MQLRSASRSGIFPAEPTLPLLWPDGTLCASISTDAGTPTSIYMINSTYSSVGALAYAKLRCQPASLRVADWLPITILGLFLDFRTSPLPNAGLHVISKPARSFGFRCAAASPRAPHASPPPRCHFALALTPRCLRWLTIAPSHDSGTPQGSAASRYAGARFPARSIPPGLVRWLRGRGPSGASDVLSAGGRRGPPWTF